MRSVLEKFVNFVDKLTEFIGQLFSLLLIPLMCIVSMEVILRYIFNSPTIWAWDVNMQLFSLLLVIGGSYAYLHDAHVRVDVVLNGLSARTKIYLDLFTSLLFFFVIGVLLWQSSVEGIEAFTTKENYSSLWSPPIYPLKLAIPFFVFLLLLQGITKFISGILKLTDPDNREV